MGDLNFRRLFLLGLVIGIGVVFFRMTEVFLVPVLLAAVFSSLFYPVYRWIRDRLGGRRALASGATCVLLLLILIVPVYLVADMVVDEAVEFYEVYSKDLRQRLVAGVDDWLERVRSVPLVERLTGQLDLDSFDWQGTLQNAVQGTGSLLTRAFNATSRGTFNVLLTVFVTLFTMFYFFMDGPNLARRIANLVPLPRDDIDAVAKRFVSTARATVKGTLVIAVAQGSLGGLTLWACGVPSPILWTVVMILASVVPMVGVWVVMYPAAAVQLVVGNYWQGIVIVVVTMVVILNVDNVLRPRLVGQETGMHDLVVFFSTLGGIGMFGPMGFIIGPLVAALFLALLDIYSAEFRADLEKQMPETIALDGRKGRKGHKGHEGHEGHEDRDDDPAPPDPGADDGDGGTDEDPDDATLIPTRRPAPGEAG